jgi:hypothetical protein
VAMFVVNNKHKSHQNYIRLETKFQIWRHTIRAEKNPYIDGYKCTTQ